MFHIFLIQVHAQTQSSDKTQITVKKSLWQNAFYIDKCDEIARKPLYLKVQFE